MLIKSRVLLVTAMALVALAACKPKDNDKVALVADTSNPKEITVATVNGTPIYQNQVEMILKQQHGMPDSAETRKMVIDNIAMQLIVAQEAVKKGLDKTADTLNEIEMAKQSVLAQAFVQDYIKHNEISEADLTAEYDKLKAQASGNQYKAHHILVKTEDEANAIVAKLNKNPKSFDALAKAQSIDPGSKTKGGDLGWFDASSMVPEFSAAVTKLEKGKFTETPVKSPFGYHVILLDDVRPSTTTVPPLDQIKAGLIQQMQQQNLRKMFDEMKAKAKIDIVAVATVTPAPATPAPETGAPASPAPDAAPAPSAPAAGQNKTN